MGHEPLLIARLQRARIARMALAGGIVLGWLSLWLIDVVLSVMFFTEPDHELLVLTSPVLLAVPWIVVMANARGRVEVTPEALVIRHLRVLRRPLVVPREQVRRILLDDGEATGRARFATGDPDEPLLWTDPVPTHQLEGRALIGDSLLPNLAVVVDPPMAMDAARDVVTAVPFGREIDPPRRRTRARAILLAVEDLEAAQRALAGWPVERPQLAGVIPAEVPEAAARVPEDAAGLVLLAVVGAATLVLMPLLFPVVLAGQAYFVYRMVTRRREAAEAARAEVERRAASLGPVERATALAAIDANLGPRRSFGPPGG